MATPPPHLPASSRCSSWNQWGRPSPPSNPAEYIVTLQPSAGVAGGVVVLSADTASAAVTTGALWTDAPATASVTWDASASLAGGTVAAFNLSGAPAGGVTFVSLGLAVVLDVNATRAANLVTRLAADFPNAWAHAGDSWEALWAAAFTPNNTVFAGHLPVVEVRGQCGGCAEPRNSVDVNAIPILARPPAQALAPSAAPVAAVYYASVVSLLQLLRWGPSAGALQVNGAKANLSGRSSRYRPSPSLCSLPSLAGSSQRRGRSGP